ncbi:hypothetical protein MRX96_024078 [Rhipicephalus microplus]
MSSRPAYPEQATGCKGARSQVGGARRVVEISAGRKRPAWTRRQDRVSLVRTKSSQVFVGERRGWHGRGRRRLATPGGSRRLGSSRVEASPKMAVRVNVDPAQGAHTHPRWVWQPGTSREHVALRDGVAAEWPTAPYHWQSHVVLAAEPSTANRLQTTRAHLGFPGTSKWPRYVLASSRMEAPGPRARVVCAPAASLPSPPSAGGRAILTLPEPQTCRKEERENTTCGQGRRLHTERPHCWRADSQPW